MERHGTSSAALTEESEAFPQVGQAVGCVASGLGLEKRGVAARNQPQAPIPFCGSPCPSGPPGLRESQPHPQEWLLIEWPKTDQEPTKYWFSTLPPETKLADLVRIAKHRWIIERDYEESQTRTGLRALRRAGLAGVSSTWNLMHRSLRFPCGRAEPFLDFPASPFSQNSSGRAAPRVRVERHNPASIATLRIQIARYLIHQLPSCPFCRSLRCNTVVLENRSSRPNIDSRHRLVGDSQTSARHRSRKLQSNTNLAGRTLNSTRMSAIHFR